MADNNLARSRNDVPDFFADGDPLAELARIVGYEERVVAKPDPLSVPAASVTAERRDPVFNLEDELLREFERYDAPRLDPVDDLGVAEPVAPATVSHQDAVVEPGFNANDIQAPSQSPAESADVAVEKAAFAPSEPWHAGAVDAVSQAFSRPAAVSHPMEQTEDDGFDFVSPMDFGLVEPEAELPVNAPAEPVTAVDSASYTQPAPSSEMDTVAFDNFDLAEELETSIVAAPTAQPVPEVRRKESFTPSFRMPLANFRSGAGVVSDRLVEQKVEAPAPVAVAPKGEDQPFQNWSFAPGASAPIVTAAVAAPILTALGEPMVAASAPVAKPSTETPLAGPAESIAANVAVASTPEPKVEAETNQFSALDELLYDVDRYSATSRVEAPQVAVAPIVESKAAAFAAPTPVAPAAAVDLLDDDLDPFADVEFELALDDLELDLADMVGEENRKIEEPVRSQVAPQAPSAPVVAASVVEPLAAAATPVVPVAAPAASAPAFVAASVAAAPVVPAPQPVQQAPVVAARNDERFEQDDDLAFDPALISESEEQPEAIADLDVPALPVTEVEEPPLYRNDYDLDIDAELASLLESPETAASLRGEDAPAQPVAAPVQAAAAASASGQSIYSDLDDFERALEEDFRRSLATPLQASDERHADQGAYMQDLDGEQSGRSVRRWIAPLAAVGILAVCGAGAYAWLGSSVTGAGGNGEPIVIAADSEPVKVAPVNPGGKTVPNQDKAVYDRVAGAAAQTPRQEQLISSSEEPVDVVQKTLMPDGVPLEGENDVQMTDVSDTEDPRLLPQDQANGSQDAGQQPVTVMPRKVKTMIVRADGTLVEQEVDAPAPAAGVEKVAAASARADTAVAPQQSAAAFPTAAQPAPAAALTPVSAPVAGAMPAANVQPVSTQPSAIEQLAEPAAPSNVRAPLPTARPSQQPTNVVAAVSDQGNVRPAPAAQAPAAAPAAQNTQVASLAPGGYVIQIASLPSQADAQKSYQNLSNKFGSVIGGRGVDIKSAEIAGKGTFYRVRIPAGSKEQAVALCEKYRSAGGSCLVAR
jgi:hypothetical protein